MELDIFDPKLLPQVRDATQLLTDAMALQYLFHRLHNHPCPGHPPLSPSPGNPYPGPTSTTPPMGTGKALPALGKEYQQGLKRVDDRMHKARQRLHRAL
ncbi:hypothetical protein QJQ45_011987 [Haematococcus lacustris]|nr:hypothetical protein QJQ45_011987 [Haematococcus lacustris]